MQFHTGLLSKVRVVKKSHFIRSMHLSVLDKTVGMCNQNIPYEVVKPVDFNAIN